MKDQKRVLNPQALLELICFAAFAAMIVVLVVTGQYRDYVTPRMIPYFILTVLVMMLWMVSALTRLFRPQHRTHALHCFVLVLPILLLLLPHSAIAAPQVSAKLAVAGAPYASTQKAKAIGQEDTPVATPSPQWPQANDDVSPSASPQWTGVSDIAPPSPDTTPTDAVTSEPTEAPEVSDAPAVQEDTADIDDVPDGLDKKNKTITVTNDTFSAWLYELTMNVDRYEGYQITITGFVFRDKSTMKGNEFVPARLMMSCCVADLAPCGFICKYDKASELKDDSWVTVTGTMHKAPYQGYDTPHITVTKVEPAQKVDGYIYP